MKFLFTIFIKRRPRQIEREFIKRDEEIAVNNKGNKGIFELIIIKKRKDLSVISDKKTNKKEFVKPKRNDLLLLLVLKLLYLTLFRLIASF